MEAVTFDNVEVERCTSCCGLFFDAREADKLKALSGSEVIDIGTAEQGQKHNSTDRIRCPRDTTPMVRIVDARQSHIHLETCPVCQGTFFDAGEFKDWKHETVLDMVKAWFARPRA
jgi:Zn-finger nucleic acid-binding protein